MPLGLRVGEAFKGPFEVDLEAQRLSAAPGIALEWLAAGLALSRPCSQQRGWLLATSLSSALLGLRLAELRRP